MSHGSCGLIVTILKLTAKILPNDIIEKFETMN